VTEADEIIRTLGLEPHPEGGWYVESHRPQGPGGRPPGTAIYCLWRRGERSHWHRVLDADEVWHFYAGDPFRLRLWSEGGPIDEHVLGNDVAAGQRPQVVVPAGVWQAGAPLGEFTLGGCTVAPGFAWEQFELAPEGWQPPAV
jgi:uncharacterized protein